MEMGRAVRAAVAGILIGLFCGTLYVEDRKSVV